MGQMLAIRTDVESPAGLRHRAKKEQNRRAALRMLAIANALEGMSRADAARVVSGSSASPCAMPSSASTPRDWPGSTIIPRATAGRC
jgi:hypothetical protein